MTIPAAKDVQLTNHYWHHQRRPSRWIDDKIEHCSRLVREYFINPTGAIDAENISELEKEVRQEIIEEENHEKLSWASSKWYGSSYKITHGGHDEIYY